MEQTLENFKTELFSREDLFNVVKNVKENDLKNLDEWNKKFLNQFKFFFSFFF